MSGTEAKKIVKAFTFEDGKLKAVELVARYAQPNIRLNTNFIQFPRHISDPNPTGKYAVLDAIDFHFDKEKARKILDKTRPAQAYGTQCPPGQPQRYSTQPYSQPPPQQPYQPPPQAVPYQPQPGAPYSQPPTQYPYPAPPTQSQPFPPPQGIPYSQAPGFSNQSPYGAPPQPMAAPYVPPTQPPYGVLPAGVPPGYPPPGGYPQQGSYPPPGGHPPTGYPNAYGYPPQ